jgi:hypothetical protein
VVPRLSAASVEGAVLELAAASPVRNAAAQLGRKVTSTLEGFKVGLQFFLFLSIFLLFAARPRSWAARSRPPWRASRFDFALFLFCVFFFNFGRGAGPQGHVHPGGLQGVGCLIRLCLMCDSPALVESSSSLHAFSSASAHVTYAAASTGGEHAWCMQCTSGVPVSCPAAACPCKAACIIAMPT